MKDKLRLARIAVLGIAVAAAVVSIQTNSGSRTAFAVGDLTVDWGVIEPGPIFVVNNAAPGDTEERDVDVTNNAPTNRLVGVRGVKTAETGSLASVLEIIISEGGVDLYGGTTGTKTLDQFFTDSAGPDAVPLSQLTPGEATTYKFKVIFPASAGNDFQNASVVFDLAIGISIPVPQECSEIDFSGPPIFGTARAENLHGTNGNDLIFGLEGADRIEGNGGDDCIVGGEGADRINGNGGNDVILGQNGSDTIKGNSGNDRLIGGAGSDSLDGEAGEDVLEGGDGSDSLNGGNNNDTLLGGAGSDSLKGGNGDDYLNGEDGSDALNGEAGEDTCLNAESVKNCEIT